MNDSAIRVRSAEQRVAVDRAKVLAQVALLETRARRLATSPLIIGGVLAATVVTASLVIARRSKPQRPAPTPWRGNRLLTLLKAARVLMALSAAVAGFNVARAGARQVASGDGRDQGRPV